MNKFLQMMKNVLWGWGIAAFVIAIGSLFSAERITLRLLRIVLAEVTLVTVTAYLLFSSQKLKVGIWIKRTAAAFLSAGIGFTVIVLTGTAPASWQLCAVFGGGVVLSFIAFLIADAAERRTLDRINEKLSRNG